MSGTYDARATANTAYIAGLRLALQLDRAVDALRARLIRSCAVMTAERTAIAGALLDSAPEIEVLLARLDAVLGVGVGQVAPAGVVGPAGRLRVDEGHHGARADVIDAGGGSGGDQRGDHPLGAVQRAVDKSPEQGERR